MFEHASAILGQENDHVICILIKAAVANFTSLLILTTLQGEMHRHTSHVPVDVI